MSMVSNFLSSVMERRYLKGMWERAEERSVTELCEALLGSYGEVSGLTSAQKILDRYARMEPDEKIAFFRYLTQDLEIAHDEVVDAVAAYRDAPTKANYSAFAQACEPQRQELARRLNQIPGATGRLVSMRKDLLELIPDHPDLGPLDVDLSHLFRGWFNRGFLDLRPINWDSPANILDKIIAYEAVHAIGSWDDLRGRLQPSDRRCFGFFHPMMADEPLIFVEVALTKGIPNSVQALLADDRAPIDAEDADTAVFYSISNCQAGLAGISFGNSLIKQVVTDISLDLPNLNTFVTLSPIPGLTRWLEQSEQDGASEADTRELAAHYLMTAKRDDGMPVDPVARFHLGNGAMIHAVHADADLSPNGIAQSRGAMVNYLYDLSKISQNHEKFIGEQTVVASSELRNLSAAANKKKVTSGS